MLPGSKKYRAVVMGVGNILWADEGFGSRAVEAFHEKWKVPEGVEVIDGGTLGYFLSDYIENTDNLLVFDCADVGGKPGDFAVIEGDGIRPWLATKVSAHQQGLNDLFATAMLLGRYPKNVAVLGCQPENLEDYGGSLTESVSGAIPKALSAARETLARWGFELEERAPGEKVPALGDEALSRGAYESGRPSETEACRYGDARFINPSDKADGK